MPTPSGLPKAGDKVYNAYFRQVFIVTGRSSNSYPMTVHIQPGPGKDFPNEMVRGSSRVRPDGTYGLLLEGDMQDLFRMGVSQWTTVPDPDKTTVFVQQCARSDVHAKHLYMPKRTWFVCHGVKSPEKPLAHPSQTAADDRHSRWPLNPDAPKPRALKRLHVSAHHGYPQGRCPLCRKEAAGTTKTPAIPIPEPTEDELHAAFMAAREHGKMLQDEVLRAIILAARKAAASRNAR